MGYWGDMYGKRAKDFIDGVIAGITAYAYWKDEKEWVGTVTLQPLKLAIAEVKQDLGYPEEKGDDK